VRKEEAEAFGAVHNMKYFETSAKTGEGVENSMNAIVQQIELLVQKGNFANSSENKTMDFQQDSPEQKGSCCSF
jgi:putative protein kinase ArgK-like GTPase of G3E family